MTSAYEYVHHQSCCLRCRRLLTAVDRRLDVPTYEPERCGYCGAPMTDHAKAQLDRPTRGPRALDEVCT